VNRIVAFAAALALCALLPACGENGNPAQESQAAKAAHPPVTQTQPEASIAIDEMPTVVSAHVDYPEEARDKQEEGTVYVKARIGTDGHVLDVQVAPDSTASPALEKAALDAVKTWTFTPAKAKGKPVETWVVVPVKFKLK
jgi:protein TonB